MIIEKILTLTKFVPFVISLMGSLKVPFKNIIKILNLILVIFIYLQTCQKLINILETLDKWLEEIPPTDQPQRFGNKAFRDWYKRLDEVHCKDGFLNINIDLV